MKLLIVSDLHGSSYYAKALYEAFIHHKPNKIICLGDILYHGPRNDLPKDYSPKEVIKILEPLVPYMICVRGNCDSEVDQMVLNKMDILSTYNILNIDNKNIFITHGHIYNPDNLPNGNYDIFMYGHTHIPVNYQKNNVIIYNPGSITLPKENNPHTYGLLDNGILKTYTLDHIEFKCK